MKVRVPDVDCERCDSRNMVLIMDVDLTKDLYKIATKDGVLNLLHTHNQFTSCTEGTVNILYVPSISYFLRESSHYTDFLANVLNNLSDIQILHFNIDVM